MRRALRIPDHQSGPRAEYERRAALWTGRVARHARQHARLANARLAVGVAAAVAAVLAVRGSLSWWWPASLAAAFGILVIVHARVLERAERARRAQRWYERGIERCADRWMGRGRGGGIFADGHPYARDLDLFGRGSLFERLNVAKTAIGEETLAAWLSAVASLHEARARQTAVAELAPALDFREDLAVSGDDARVADTSRLIAWAEAAPVTLPQLVAWLLGAAAAVTIAAVVAAYLAVIPASFAILWLLVEAVLAVAWHRRLHPLAHGGEMSASDLGLLAGLIARIEGERFGAPWLGERQQMLGTGHDAASRAIRRLRQLVSLLESSTHNLLFAPVTRALLLPEQLELAIGRWHAAYGRLVLQWLRAAGEIEALASLAAYAYERPSDPFPSLVDDGALFDARGLGHPLIADELSVRNDVRLGGDTPHVVVISGSNMSGKSTMLRSVGMNVVLALAGAPVRASALRLSVLSIGVSMRIDDSIQEGHSRFYAEILRIKGIVEIARRGVPLLFLLDEILHGTNSRDRRVGAEGIVRALVSRGAIGLITTHDLALTELGWLLGPAAANAHFEDRMEEGRMRFDYRMRPGVVEHSNALALMRAVGLEV